MGSFCSFDSSEPICGPSATSTASQVPRTTNFVQRPATIRAKRFTWTDSRQTMYSLKRDLPAIASRLRALRFLLASTALLSAVAVTGCGGSEASTSAEPKLVSPPEFEQALAEPARVSINVHTPDEGSIEGTDVTIPFDQIEARQDELPDTSTPLAVYCRSGNMSADAVQTLADLGYVDVVELEGGMVAWEASGRPLLPPAA